MQKILITFLVAVLAGTTVLYIEYCWFGEGCAVNSAEAEENIRGPDKKLISDSPIINYVYRAGGTGEPKLFGEGSVLHSGDAYKILFEPAKDGYVYIFQMDSSHKLFRLFPTNNFKNADPNNVNPVKKGQPYFVPAENWSFRLDNTTGDETIYFVVTNQPDPTLENHYQSLLAQQETSNFQERLTARQQWHTTMKSRGPDVELMPDMGPTRSPIQFQENGQQFTVMPQFLKNMCEGCVYIVNFEHH
jgi:hypothetical protein